MASPYGKFLASVTIPTGGWDFVFTNAGGSETVTLPAGTYSSPVEVASDLQDLVQAVIGHGNDLFEISSTGTFTIRSAAMLTVTYASTANGLESLFGIAGTESFSSGTLTASTRIRYGWYPGVIMRGTSSGAGIISDTGWLPEVSSRAQIAGSGRRREIGPSRPPYTRDLTIGLIDETEFEERDRGPKILMDRHRYSRIIWAPDREDVTVATPGSQGDPGSPHYDEDGDCEYWIVTLASSPRVLRNQNRPDYMTVQLSLNAEPIES